MPTLLRLNGFRFFIFSNEHMPVHVHVEKANKLAKYNLDPISLARNIGFTAKELKQIRKIVEQNKEEFQKAWNEHLNN